MRALLLIVLVSLTACQALPSLPALPVWQGADGRQHPDVGRIVDLRSGETLTPERLLERLATARQLLVGERHDNPDHHALQLWLLEALPTRRAQGSLLLEMLNPDQQARVDAVRRSTPEKPADLPAALAWQDGWDWQLYGPLVRHALRQPYPLLAANLDRSEISTVYRQPPRLEGTWSTAVAVREQLSRQIRASHCGMLPGSQVPAMLAVQQQRDRRMAERLLAAPAPALLLAGAFHARRDVGVPLHLRDLGAREGVQVLLLAEAGETVTAAQADYVWYTPALAEVDYCAQFRPAPGG